MEEGGKISLGRGLMNRVGHGRKLPEVQTLGIQVANHRVKPVLYDCTIYPCPTFKVRRGGVLGCGDRGEGEVPGALRDTSRISILSCLRACSWA